MRVSRSPDPADLPKLAHHAGFLGMAARRSGDDPSSRVCDNRRMTVTIPSRALGPASAEVVGSIRGLMVAPG
jgi:hypothetical protein